MGEKESELKFHSAMQSRLHCRKEEQRSMSTEINLDNPPNETRRVKWCIIPSLNHHLRNQQQKTCKAWSFHSLRFFLNTFI